MNIRTSLLVSATLLSAAGCFTVKTESEIKPIHITMDVNLKVDKELDKAFANEDMKKPQGDFKEIKALLDRKVAGINSKAHEGIRAADRLLNLNKTFSIGEGIHSRIAKGEPHYACNVLCQLGMSRAADQFHSRAVLQDYS